MKWGENRDRGEKALPLLSFELLLRGKGGAMHKESGSLSWARPTISQGRSRTHACYVAVLGFFLSFSAYAITVSEDDFLLLDFYLDRQRIAASVSAYRIEDTALISLSEAASALDFPIVSSPASGTANGWFLDPMRTFRLDVNQQFVEVEGKRLPLSEGEVVIDGDSLLVRIESFSRWFPVTLNLDSASLVINVIPKEPLPVQDRVARRKSGARISGIGAAQLPYVESPYRVIGTPVADVGLGYSIRRTQDGDKAATGLAYSSLIAGDMAWMDGRIYLSGSDRNSLSNARFTLSRDNLNMPLGLRYVEIGDISPITVAGSGYSGIERGILVQGGGSALGRDDLISGDTFNLNGDALQGWDVELFQNGMRIGFQSVGGDGRYEFRDIQPISGENNFELVFYGPSGERRTERVTRYSGMQPDQPGSVRYQFSVSEKGKQIYEPTVSPTKLLSDQGSARLTGGIDIRLLSRLSLRGAWNSVVVNGERKNYQSIGLRSGWRDINIGVDAIRDPYGGTRWDGSLQFPASMRVLGFDTRLTHTHYARGVMRRAVDADADQQDQLEYRDYDLKLSSRTSLAVAGPIGPVSTRFEFSHNREQERTSTSLSAGFTARYQRVNFGNTLNYFRFGKDRVTGLQDQDRVDGSFFFSTSAYPLSVRGGAYYTLTPDAKVHQYYLDANLRIASDMTMAFGVQHLPLTGVTRYTSGFNWQLPQITLSPRITYDSDGTYSGFVYASFSLAPRPDLGGVIMRGRSMAESASIAARVFVDHDRSGTFSQGDEPIEGASIRAPQAYRTGISDSGGLAVLTTMPTDRVTDVLLEQDSLKDPSMVSTHAGNSIRPRAGAPMMIDFPVVPTGEIDGKIYVVRNGLREPLAGAMVQLRDGDGDVVDFKVSAHDGYFLFVGVPYDEYALELAGDYSASAKQLSFKVGAEQRLHSNLELVARPPSAPVAQIGEVNPAPYPVTSSLKSVTTTSAQVMPAAKEVQEASRSLGLAGKEPKGGKVAQLGAFGNRHNAENYVKQLDINRILPSTDIRIVNDQAGPRVGLHRIVATQAGVTGEALCQRLKAVGIKCAVVLP